MHEDSVFNSALSNNSTISASDLLKNTYRVVILGIIFSVPKNKLINISIIFFSNRSSKSR